MRVLSETAPLPTVRALGELWAEVARKPLWAPPNFWRYLKLRYNARLTLIDPARVKVLAPAGKVNDCSACTDNCCIGKHSTVQLRLCDIATLVDIGRTDLITHDKPTFSTEELAARPALALQVASEGWRTFPVLKQNRFHACLALTDEGRCALYPRWPTSCARFPYALHADAAQIFYSPRCDSFWIRPDARAAAQAMVVAAVAAYNERVKDYVLLAYARERLAGLGLTTYLHLDPAN